MKHLYNSGLIGKTKWFVKRFGWQELWRKPLRRIFWPLFMPLNIDGQYNIKYQGVELRPKFDRHNCTWAGERCIELAIARYYGKQYKAADILEVGNVTAHYYDTDHLIVDKYERGVMVLNEDICTFNPPHKYTLIISISTFEHIGFDDDSGSTVLDAVDQCYRLLAPNGKLVITLPIGYNPAADVAILMCSGKVTYYVRTGFSRWEECSRDTAFMHPYGCKYPYANAIAVLEITK